MPNSSSFLLSLKALRLGSAVSLTSPAVLLTCSITSQDLVQSVLVGYPPANTPSKVLEPGRPAVYLDLPPQSLQHGAVGHLEGEHRWRILIDNHLF